MICKGEGQRPTTFELDLHPHPETNRSVPEAAGAGLFNAYKYADHPVPFGQRIQLSIVVLGQP